jgi:hypothetical protein
MIRISCAVTSEESNTETELFPVFSDTNQSKDTKWSFNSIVFKLQENVFEARYWHPRAASTYQNSANMQFKHIVSHLQATLLCGL